MLLLSTGIVLPVVQSTFRFSPISHSIDHAFEEADQVGAGAKAEQKELRIHY